MPSYNITVPAASPLIGYSAGNWTFSATVATCANQNAGCSLSIPFSATGIFLQGTAVPQNNFSVTIDGRTETSDRDWDFGVVFAKVGLAPGPHVLDLHLSPNSGVDAHGFLQIDTVSILMGDGDPTTLAQPARIEPTDTNFTYAGKHGLESSPSFTGGVAVPIGGLAGSIANITFYGNDIAVYGVVEDVGIPYTYNVSLDGDLALVSALVPTNFTSSGVLIPSALLYQSGNLTLGPHHVLITVSNDSDSGFELEHADVNTYFNLSASTGTPVNTPATASASTKSATEPVTSTSEPTTAINRSSPPIAPIAGGIIGGLVLIAVVMACAFYFLRRRFRRTRFTFVGEDGIDGGNLLARPEEDMPPPDYQRVFARGSGATRHDRQRHLPDARPSALRWFFGVKQGRDQSQAPLETSEIHPLLADIAEPANARHPPLPRPGTDPSLLVWKGQLPVDNRKKVSKLGALNWRSGLT